MEGWYYPRSIGDEGRAWIDKLLETRDSRLDRWDKSQYLEVLHDLLVRTKSPTISVHMMIYADEKDINQLDTYVVNLTALAIERGVLDTPEQNASH